MFFPRGANREDITAIRMQPREGVATAGLAPVPIIVVPKEKRAHTMSAAEAAPGLVSAQPLSLVVAVLVPGKILVKISAIDFNDLHVAYFPRPLKIFV